MKKLSKSYLRDIILEEIQLLNEELEIDSIMKRVLREDSEGEETYNYGEDEGEDKKRLDYLMHHGGGHDHEHDLEKDMEYDEDHEDRHEKGTHFHENALEEDGNVDENWSWEEGMENAALANAKNPELNIGESTVTNKTIDYDKYLSRGALYRKRYYGRY